MLQCTIPEPNCRHHSYIQNNKFYGNLPKYAILYSCPNTIYWECKIKIESLRPRSSTFQFLYILMKRGMIYHKNCHKYCNDIYLMSGAINVFVGVRVGCILFFNLIRITVLFKMSSIRTTPLCSWNTAKVRVKHQSIISRTRVAQWVR
jgi:hypothetical protein